MRRSLGRAVAPSLVVAALAGALGAAACAPSATPSPSTPAAPSALPSATATTPVDEGCVIPTQMGVLPSDRVIDAEIATSGVTDRITFRFGSPSGPSAESRGTLRRVTPPFFEGGSGAEVTVEGDRFIEIRFDGLLIVSNDGTPTYRGERDQRPDLPAISDVAVIDEFEGVMTWIVGFRGPGCVVLSSDPAARLVTIDIGHG